MSNYIIKITVVAMCILIVGCGASQYIKTSNTEDSCQVYVFRDSFALLYSFDLEVDKKAYAKMSDESYIRLYLPSGNRTISANWFTGSGGVDLDVPITCNPKETLYIAFSGKAEGAVGGFTRKIYSFGLSEEDANKRMQSYKKIGQ